MHTTHVIRRPVITEKSMEAAKKGKFSFLVARDADKDIIKKAVEDQFKVEVISVETTVQKGKTKRVGMRRMEKTMNPIKKAVVTLKEGQKIDMFDLGV